MTSSLVGSEMCIRDRWSSPVKIPSMRREGSPHFGMVATRLAAAGTPGSCLLYTSDAADDM
eukprot:6489148-Prorocentrum_lima.AAC.1